MNETNELKRDKEIDQKFVLVSFLSENKKREKGKTIGLVVYGSYENQEQIDNEISTRRNNGLCDFDIETVDVGKWLSFPDYTKDTRTDKIFVEDSKQTSSGISVNTNDVFKSLNSNISIIKNQNENIEKSINEKTYLENDQNLENIEELIRVNCMHLVSKYNDINFFNEAIEKNNEKINNLKEPSEQEIQKELKESDKDYISIYSSLEKSKKKMIFTYVDEKSTRQKGVDFCFKFRGCYSDEQRLQERIEQLKIEDPVYDICVIPAGVWIPFNPYKDYEESYKDLNNLLSREKKNFDKEKKNFNNRIDNVRKGGKDECEIILNKEEILETNKLICEKLKETRESANFLEKTLAENRKKLPEDHVIQNPDLVEMISKLPENMRF